mgnify:CR=1 FL=1
MKILATTAPKKTWGGRWFSQVPFFAAIFVKDGQERASKSPTSLSWDTLVASVGLDNHVKINPKTRLE